jgi:hypothetical protein
MRLMAAAYRLCSRLIGGKAGSAKIADFSQDHVAEPSVRIEIAI